MTIKPLDVLHLLDDEDLAQMRYSDLYNLCTAITLDLQIEREKKKGPEVILA